MKKMFRSVMSSAMPMMMMMMVSASAVMMCVVSSAGGMMFQNDLYNMFFPPAAVGAAAPAAGTTANVASVDETLSDAVLEDARRKELQALSPVNVDINKPVEATEGTNDIVASTGSYTYLACGMKKTVGKKCHDFKEDIHCLKGTDSGGWGRTVWIISRIMAPSFPQFSAYYIENYWRKTGCNGDDQKKRYLCMDKLRDHFCGSKVGIADLQGQPSMWFFLPVPNEPGLYYIENAQCRADNAAQRFLNTDTSIGHGMRTFTDTLGLATKWKFAKVTMS